MENYCVCLQCLPISLAWNFNMSMIHVKYVDGNIFFFCRIYIRAMLCLSVSTVCSFDCLCELPLISLNCEHIVCNLCALFVFCDTPCKGIKKMRQHLMDSTCIVFSHYSKSINNIELIIRDILCEERGRYTNERQHKIARWVSAFIIIAHCDMHWN